MAVESRVSPSAISAIRYYETRNPHCARDPLDDLAKRASVSAKHLRSFYLTNSSGALFADEVRRVVAVVIQSTDFDPRHKRRRPAAAGAARAPAAKIRN